MKKKTIKALDLLAQKLPESLVIRKHTITKFGGDLPYEEIKKINGEYDPRQVYRKKDLFFFRINHLTKLKKAWAKDKQKGIQNYIIWLNRNNRYVNRFVSEQNKLKEVDSRIMDLTKRSAVGFWKGLLAFLFSFIEIFQKQSNED